MATRNPSLGLTHHIYNRLQAGCYLTIDFVFKELKGLITKIEKIKIHEYQGQNSGLFFLSLFG